MSYLGDLTAMTKDRFVVYSLSRHMPTFLDTYGMAKGEKPEYYESFSGVPIGVYQDNLRGLNVYGDSGQVMDSECAPHVADEIRRKLIEDHGSSKPPPAVIVDGNRLLPAITFLAKNWSGRLTEDERKRLYIVVESLPTGPVVTHDLEFAQSVAYA